MWLIRISYLTIIASYSQIEAHDHPSHSQADSSMNIPPGIYESGTERVVVGSGGHWGQKREREPHFLLFVVVVQCPGCVWLFTTPWTIVACNLFPGIILNAFLMCVCSVMSDSVTPWTVAHQAPLSMGFSWQESWGGLPFPSPRALPGQGRYISCISCIDSWILYYWATCEVLYFHHSIFFSFTNIKLRWLLFLFHI